MKTTLTREEIIRALVNSYLESMDRNLDATVRDLVEFGGPGYRHLTDLELAEAYEDEIGEAVEVSNQ